MIAWDAYCDFWYFISERHRIYLKREAGGEKPWSNEPIFQNWKFCNVFRQLDKQSKFLINEVILPHWNSDPSLLLFNIFAFRAFNLWRTYQSSIGWSAKWDPLYIKMLLRGQINAGNPITSGAYMLRGKEGEPKYSSIVDTLTEIWNRKEELLTAIEEVGTLQGAWQKIVDAKFWGWGPFTSYQIALDLTYSPILINPEDINEWCCFGPGAVKGLLEIWPDLPRKQDFLLAAAQHLLVDQVKYREPHVPILTLQDIEFSLCELQKYRRIKLGGRGKEKFNGV